MQTVAEVMMTNCSFAMRPAPVPLVLVLTTNITTGNCLSDRSVGRATRATCMIFVEEAFLTKNEIAAIGCGTYFDVCSVARMTEFIVIFIN